MKRFTVRNILLYVGVMLTAYACTTAPSQTSSKEQQSDVQKRDVQRIQTEGGRGGGMNSSRPAQNAAYTAAADNGSQSPKIETSPVKPIDERVDLAVKNGNQLNPNRFNRLLEKRHSSLSQLHDPNNPSLKYLQKPAEAFAQLPKARTGNMVDWVKAVENGKINPRYDLNDPNAKPMVMDLNIVMQVKGSMPDVVFPHRVHTRWLDCSNCHPAIFIPQSGANKMSMADNLLGKRCGLCHGKVAFPLSTCTKCHSNKKVVVKEKK